MKKLILISAMSLSACTVGPDYQVPEVARTRPESGGFAEQGAHVDPRPLPPRWWQLYDDPVLDRLIAEALAHNPDVRTAAANLTQARAVLSEQRGARLPQTGLQGSATYARVSPAGILAGSASGSARSVQTDYYSAGFDASYEVDLFGGVARAIEAARGDVEAVAAQLDAARVAIAAETAKAYVQACSSAAQRDVAAETAALQRRTLELTQSLASAGRGTERDVRRADVVLAQSEATVPSFEAERRASLYALTALTGLPPEDLDADAAACVAPPGLDAPIPIGDGATLLARRPDVRAAERALAADTARVGVAVADLYPSIRLLGSIGFGGTSPGNAFKPSGFSFSVGPLISWNFPNQTVARARIRQARAGADASLARFDGTVLAALREVEQALARYKGELERNVVLERAERSSERAAALSKQRFDNGADSFLLLIDAERDRATARAELAQSRRAVAEAQISLFKALGGGWEQTPEPERR